MLSKSGNRLFKNLGMPVDQLSDLLSGVQIASAINKIFYDNQNDSFQNRIIKQNLDRKGNHIINANNILKQIKNDQNIRCPQQIRKMTSFTLIQNEKQMNIFIDWLAKQYEIRNNTKKIIYQESSRYEDDRYNTSNYNGSHIEEMPQKQYQFEEKQHRQDNALDNVYFCHRDLTPGGVQTPPENDSLDDSERVVKKGSFKIVRPKQKFSKFSEDNNEQKLLEIGKNQIGLQKQQIIIDDIIAHSEQKQPEARITVPKISQRPPLYKKLNNRDTTKSQNRQIRDKQIINSPAPFYPSQNEKQYLELEKPAYQSNQRYYKQNNSKSSNSYQKIKNEHLSQQLASLDSQIQKEKKNNNMLDNNSRRNRSLSATQRKLFKVDIPEIQDSEKKQIVEWLISINLLNTIAASYYDRLHQICKNGVIFPEIINHQKGRGADLCYFKKPKRSAQVHSNYQKIFGYLKQIGNFSSDLLFMYEYFVPEAQQNAFWSLLLSCKQAFQRPNKKNSKNTEQVYTRESAIKTKLSNSESKSLSRRRTPSAKKQSQDKQKQIEYQRIKYGSSSQFKKTPKNRKNSLQNKLQRKQSFQFINKMPEKKSTKKQELIQKEEPIQLLNRGSMGYRELHQFKKNHSNSITNINTPQKKINTDFSMSRSRINSNSLKKLTKMQNPQLPSVSLEMQMKATKFLQQKKYYNDLQYETDKTLFEDPIRNGTLVNKIIQKQIINQNHRYCIRPKNIDDCRHNFRIAFTKLKSHMIQVPCSYEHHFQQIIRGQISFFYGLIWFIAYGSKVQAHKGESLIIPHNQHSLTMCTEQADSQNIIMWIQTIEKQSNSIAKLQIRDISTLRSALINSNLLYKIAEILINEKYTVKPTYDQPINHIQQESNLKKILGFLAHNKVLKSQYAWKARSIVKKDRIIIIQLMKDLMNFYIKKGAKNQQKNAMSLAKYMRLGTQKINTSIINKSQPIQNLLQQQKKHSTKDQQKQQNLVIQVEWMRKLGYTGDLSLNNGVILCRIISQLTMQSIKFNENPHSKAECMTNIRKAIKLVEKFRWDEYEICCADQKLTYDIYKFLREKYKNSYVMKFNG